MRHGDIDAVLRRHVETGPRAGRGGKTLEARWRRPGSDVEHVEIAFAADDEYTLRTRVVEDVVGVADDVDRRCRLAGLRVEDQQPGRTPAADEQAMVVGIESHRIVRRGRLDRPRPR